MYSGLIREDLFKILNLEAIMKKMANIFTLLLFIVLVFGCKKVEMGTKITAQVSEDSHNYELLLKSQVLVKAKTLNGEDIGTIGTIESGKLELNLPELDEAILVNKLGDIEALDDMKIQSLEYFSVKEGYLFLADSFKEIDEDTILYPVYANKQGRLSYENKFLTLNKGWNFLTPDCDLILLKDAYADGYKWFVYFD
jgi:hypothetical protein